MKNSVFLLVMVFVLSFTACSSRRFCNSVDATRLGEEDASQWYVGKPNLSRGDACSKDDYSVSSFSRDYSAGFNNVLSRNCSENAASLQGERDGASGITLPVNLNKFQSCSAIGVKFAALEAAYRRGFASTFCTDSRIEASGREDAQQYRRADHSAVDRFCSKGDVARLTGLFMLSYQRTLEPLCSESFVLEKASSDASDGSDLYAEIRKLEVCPDARAVISSYRSAYERRKLELQLLEERKKRDAEILALKNQVQQQGEELRMQRLKSTRVDFEYEKSPLFTYCEIKNSRAHVSVNNPNSFSASLNGEWTILFFNAQGMALQPQKQREWVSVSGGSSAEFSVFWTPSGAASCKASYLK